MERKKGRELLDYVIKDPTSDLYLSSNTKLIKEQLQSRGYEVSKKEIRAYLLSQKFSPNVPKIPSERKMSEVSKSHVGDQTFFSHIHGDVMVLSRKRGYFTSDYYILVVVEHLSGKIFLEKMRSTRFVAVKSALQRIFSRCSELPEKLKMWTSDLGSEFVNHGFKSWMKSMGVKLNYTRRRMERGSKGASKSEIAVKKVRMILERHLSQRSNKKKERFEITLKQIEDTLSRRKQPSLKGMSAEDAIKSDAKHVAMIRHSRRFEKRKYLKKEIQEDRLSMIDIFSIVRIKKFTKKDTFYKESYSTLSQHLFVVIDAKINDFITCYTVGSLFSLEAVSEHTFTFHELVSVPISFAYARYVECINNPGSIVSTDNNDEMIEFKPEHSPFTFVGPKSMIRND